MTTRKLVPDPFAKSGPPMVSEALAEVHPSARFSEAVLNHYGETEPGFKERVDAERGRGR